MLNEVALSYRACFTQRWVEDGEFLRVAGDFGVAGKAGRRRFDAMCRNTMGY